MSQLTAQQLDYILQHHQPYLLDVRTKEEYCEEHLCSAINIETPKPPLTDKDKKELEEKLRNIGILDKNTMIVIYCKLGIRAGIAKNILKNMGYTNVKSLGGVETEPLQSLIDNHRNKNIQICQCKK